MRSEQDPVAASFRPEGLGRFFTVAFLVFWLAWWVIGEAAGLVGLAGITLALVRDALDIGPGAATSPRAEAAVVMGLFLLGWLGLWTLGGWGVLGEVLRLAWSEDRIEADGERLVLATRRGPFRRVESFAAADVRRIELARRDAALVAETARGPVELTRLGSLEERARLRDRLRVVLALAAGPLLDEEDAVSVPHGWESERGPGDATRLRTCSRVRRSQAIFAGVLAAVLAGWIALAVASHGAVLPWSTGAVGVLLALAGLDLSFAALAVWLAAGRTEYVLGPRSASVRRVLAGREWTRTLEPASITLTRSTDGDGDEHFALWVEGPAGKRKLASGLNEARPLVHLGRWIGARIGAPLRVLDIQ